MPCNNVDPCNNCNVCTPDYTDLGCPDYPKSGCIIYDGDDIPCLSIVKTENLNEILEHLQTVICNLAPTAYEDFDYGCFSGQGINTEQEFVEFISATLCEVLGTQIPGGITSLSTLNTAIQSNLTNINLIKNQNVISCFQTLASLTATENISALLLAVQTLICSLNTRVTALEISGGLALTATDSQTIDFTTSGTLNHTLTGSVILSPNANNSLTSAGNGLYVSSPVITSVDSQSVNLTASGTLNHTLQADIIVSPSSGNILTIEFDGLFAKPLPIQPVDSTTIDFTFINDQSFTGSIIIDPNVNNILTATGAGLFVNGSSLVLSNNSVTNSILRDSVAYSVIGRTSGTTGDPADIQANADEVLRRSGSGNLAFGSLVTNNIGAGQITFPKIQNIASSRLLGRSSGGSGSVEELTIGSNMNLAGGILNTIGNTLVKVTTFDSSGTWTKSAGTTKVIVQVLGGGGGGGGALAAASEASAGGGGGAGGYSMNQITSGLGATETVTVGSGGAGGSSGTSYIGVDGGTSSFGSHVSCTGGAGGFTMPSGTTNKMSQRAFGGSYTSSATTIVGSGGQSGECGIRLGITLSDIEPGSGASSQLGGNVGGLTSSQGKGYGGFGSRADDGSDSNGATGAPGIVIVYEYT